MPLFKQEKLNLPSNLLQDKYLVPPFSILNTITQNWQKRKDAWESLGIYSKDGRDVGRHNATPVNTFSARGTNVKQAEGLSTFDPFLCELMYKWFSNEGDTILDPFAGGSVRGIVAKVLKRNYVGVDLSKQQVDANFEQMRSLQDKYDDITGFTQWINGDSASVLDEDFVCRRQYNMLFTCPPYYNLERYSTDDRDLSNMSTYEEFIDRYGYILNMAVKALTENSFVVIVVSEIRNPKTGEYYGFVPDTINILRMAGLHYYNEIILENNIGSLPIRAPKYFDQSRKIGRHHQNILVFWKGDTQEISKKFKRFEVE